MTNKKAYVLDTNVVLADPEDCLNKFLNNDVFIPITVIEELDGFKKGNEDVNFSARKFMRVLNSLRKCGSFEKGVSLGRGKGKLFITLRKEFCDALKFFSFKPDHYILNAACMLKESGVYEDVILKTNDLNLIIKANSVAVRAEEYTIDTFVDESKKDSVQIVEGVDGNLIDQIYKESCISNEKITFDINNGTRFLILKNTKQSALVRYDSSEQMCFLLKKHAVSGIVPRNAEQVFAFSALCDKNVPLVTLEGKAGTGKTLLAIASAIELIKRRVYENVLVARPMVSLSNKDMGHLPGEVKDKVSPFMKPLWDTLAVIAENNNELECEIDDIFERGLLSIEPLAFIRGRTLPRILLIIDEAQNLTPHEVKTIITRAGVGAKIVLVGDTDQIDSPYLTKRTNGLSHVIRKMYGQNMYAHIQLKKSERSALAELGGDLL